MTATATQPVDNTYPLSVEQDPTTGTWGVSNRWVHVLPDFSGSIIWTIVQPENGSAAFDASNGIQFFGPDIPPNTTVVYNTDFTTATLTWSNDPAPPSFIKYKYNIKMNDGTIIVDPAVINEGSGG